jgi:hypothetical protein
MAGSITTEDTEFTEKSRKFLQAAISAGTWLIDALNSGFIC